MEYIIQENTEAYGWCLFTVCKGDREFAEKCLEKLQLEHPDKELRIAEVPKEDCWWNDTFLSN